MTRWNVNVTMLSCSYIKKAAGAFLLRLNDNFDS